MSKCKDCGKESNKKGRGFCPACYMRRKLAGEFTDKVCSVSGCDRPFYAKDMCARHLGQVRKYGFVFGNPGRTSRDENEFLVIGDIVEIKLFDRRGRYVESALIDSDDLTKCSLHQWHLSGKGYVESRINRKLVKLHQFVMNTKHIDHKNRNKLDNRKDNLRPCTVVQNMANASSRGGTSRFKGVWSLGVGKKWASCYRYGGTRYWLGCFSREEDAALAYNEKAKELAREFAFLNEI